MASASMEQAANPTDPGYEHDNLHHVVITATCFAFVLSTTSVALRLWVRKITNTSLFLDDYLILGGLFFLYGISIAGIVLLYNGLGTHIIYVPPDNLVVYLKTLTSGAFLYPLCIACIKLSMLALYKRIFSRGPMVPAANIVGCIVIVWCFGVCLIGAMICIPFEKMWNPMVAGGCIDLPKFYYGLQIPNIVTDAVIIVMPMKPVADLQISAARKLVLAGIFALGIVTLIFDIVRLITLIQLSQAGDDITYNQVPPSVWTCIEPAIGITAACLINMRPLFTRYVAKFNWWTRLRSSKSSSAEGDNRNKPGTP
ncbi:uncharacterized protein ACLA_059780 [Aspergillus clavatus NRRL 1]|uniref:Rhodopsin domain-containing protein n=1 Tax=Aspergillus clavatus (strain ATCC 1007 / CBS 513.65 / DSM 816 / NCTC 3887 / NRRL 1 / QM 1276 / 107) TaxID=344612 RepID=A1C4H1_ASPCL|nr:uncharacterized protein ACLA_059780 [Aspergillus clavatus NRRL 1]EAW15311.1 conserved hypothetical protein [Aspergillus clavatus NRRL 1]